MRASTPLPLLLSLLLHAALAGGLMIVPQDARPPGLEPVILTDRDLPEPPPEPDPPEPEPEPPPEPQSPPDPEPVKQPQVAAEPVKRREVPRPPSREPETAEPEGQPDSDTPAADDTGAKTFGIEMEGSTKGPSGTGVAVPRGETLQTDPGVRRVGQGKPEGRRRGFKKTYAEGEFAPLSVVTQMPRLIRNVEPRYPPELEELGIEGVVVLRLRIDERGRVVQAKVLRGLHPIADRQAQREVEQLRFTPAKVNQTSVAIEIEYRFNFVLD